MPEEETKNQEIANLEDGVEVNSKKLWEEEYLVAESILNQMTLKEKISQLFLVRYPGSSALEEVKEKAPGGYILFARDFKNTGEVIEGVNYITDKKSLRFK